jgi:hypothetical protein
MNWRHSSD